jgi:O-acetyl-ADP-ribose deacetylase (regulator of RNase III)
MNGAHSRLRVVVAAPGIDPPFPLDAVMVEEDTYLVLGAEPVAREMHEPPERALEEAEVREPEIPGSVLVMEGSPLRFLAVVHDLGEEPSWREEWIASALVAALQEAEARGVRSLSLPMLGTLYGTLEAQRFVELLQKALGSTWLGRLENVWLVVPADVPRQIFERLRELDIDLEC